MLAREIPAGLGAKKYSGHFFHDWARGVQKLLTAGLYLELHLTADGMFSSRIMPAIPPVARTRMRLKTSSPVFMNFLQVVMAWGSVEASSVSPGSGSSGPLPPS